MLVKLHEKVPIFFEAPTVRCVIYHIMFPRINRTYRDRQFRLKIPFMYMKCIMSFGIDNEKQVR